MSASYFEASVDFCQLGNWDTGVVVNQRNCPRPAQGKQNLSGIWIRRFRSEAGLTLEELTSRLQVAGWDVDRAVVARIEYGQRSLLDYELKFFLDVFGKNLHDISWE